MRIGKSIYLVLCEMFLSEEACTVCKQQYDQSWRLINAAQGRFYKVLNLTTDVKIELYAFADYLLSLPPNSFLPENRVWYLDDTDSQNSYDEECLEEEKQCQLQQVNENNNVTNDNFSLYDAVEEVLNNEMIPLTIERLGKDSLQARPDSNSKSIRAIIMYMLKSGRLRQFNENLVGLPHVDYGGIFIETTYNGRESFEERLSALSKFVSDNGRFPFFNSKEELSLAHWYSRNANKASLETSQLVALYQFQQNLSEKNIPQTVAQYNVQQHCAEYKAFVMRSGKLVNTTNNYQLYSWFHRSCTKYSKLDAISKAFFDDLLNCLASFGFTFDLQ